MKPIAGTAVKPRTISPPQVDKNQSIEPTRNSEIPQDSRVVVVIPAYNEERFIGSVVIKARQFTKTVIVVDDGSTDATGQIASVAGAIVVSHQDNLGKGAALNTGFCKARQYNPQVVVCMDGDGQHLPEEIERLIQPVLHDGIDIVVGSRYLEPNNTVPRLRHWGHKVFNFLTRLTSGVSVSDSQSGFRALSPRALEVSSFCSQDFSVESEMQFLAQEHKLLVMEERVTIHYTDPPKRSVLVHGMWVLNGLLRLVGQHRPMVFFGISGGVVFMLGIGWGLRVVQIFRRTSQLAVGYALISVLLSMIGTIVISTGFTLHSIRSLLIDLLKKRNEDSSLL